MKKMTSSGTPHVFAGAVQSTPTLQSAPGYPLHFAFESYALQHLPATSWQYVNAKSTGTVSCGGDLTTSFTRSWSRRPAAIFCTNSRYTWSVLTVGYR
mgnify:CR=1 FL=1